jgi:hypothetical protein
MKIINVLVVVFVILFIINSTTLAEKAAPIQARESEGIEVVNIFTWATGPSPDWGRGGLYAFLGLIGALVTVFGLIGGAIHGTAGFVRIEAGMKRVEEREKFLDKLIKIPNVDAKRLEVVEKATDNLRDDMKEDRWRQFLLAALLYALLGAFFAAFIARDLLQALAIGAGWTAFIGALGLKRDYAERKSMKDETTEKLTDIFEGAVKTGKVPDQSELDEFKMEAQVSKAI